jgi:hypothetical protein
MKIGTKSILFGAHCFLLHPWFVLIAWIKLYGFPLDPRLWLAFFVHDLGYLGKPNMDGPEGETHVELGAKIMSLFDGLSLLKVSKIYKNYPKYSRDKYILLIGGGYTSKLALLGKKGKWYNFSLYHSRFYAKKDNQSPSRLCVADKLAITLTPAWLYLPMSNWTGEIHEYMKLAKARETAGEQVNKYESMKLNSVNQKEWYKGVQIYLKRWAYAHKENQNDTWTPKK